jgi:TonB family protein
MRLWLQTYTPTTAVTPSAMLSVAAHVVLIGAAVYGTGEQSRQLTEEISQRVFYLPPRDRTPASTTLAERIQYVDVGNGARLTDPESLIGAPAGEVMPKNEVGRQGAPGVDPLDQPSTMTVPSADSVYSILSLEESAVRTEGSAAPIYPPELIEKGVEGAVLTRFVIDTTGRADTTTLEIVQATHLLFVQSVRTAVPGMRFSPAMVQGRKVRQVVEQRFQFRITPPPVAAPAEHTRTNPVP